MYITKLVNRRLGPHRGFHLGSTPQEMAAFPKQRVLQVAGPMWIAFAHAGLSKPRLLLVCVCVYGIITMVFLTFVLPVKIPELLLQPTVKLAGKPALRHDILDYERIL